MLDAKVDAPVILAYIQNSPGPYNPDATELIALKEHGASTELLVALLHRGDELRLQLAQAQCAINPPPVAPTYDYPPAAYPVYPYGYDDSSAPYPPTDYSYTYGWPFAYGPSVRINGYGPYLYAHGRYYRGGGCPNWAAAVRPAPYAPQSVSNPGSGEHTSSPVAHSSGLRGSGHSGGRSR